MATWLRYQSMLHRRKLNPTPSKGRVEEREDGGLKHILHLLESRPYCLLCTRSWSAPPPPPPPRTRKGPPVLKYTHKHKNIHTTQVPMYPPAGPCRKPRYPRSTPRVPLAPCPLFPPPSLSIHFWNCRALSLSASHPQKEGKGSSASSGKGEDGVLRLIPVCFWCAQTV
jgi:hypothetical protein